MQTLSVFLAVQFKHLKCYNKTRAQYIFDWKRFSVFRCPVEILEDLK